jgi:hypothetical protein
MVPSWYENGMQNSDDASTTLQPVLSLSPTSLVLLVVRPVA